MTDDWFRRPDWDDVARREFEVHLARARLHNRAQYLRVKAIALQVAGEPAAARDRLLRVVDEYRESLDYGSALELLGDLARAQGLSEAAETYYRRLLADRPHLNATSQMVETSLAEVLIRRGAPSDLHEAVRLLTAQKQRTKSWFNNRLFRWNLALADVAWALGDGDTLRSASASALKLLDQEPQLPRHPTVGIVRTDRATVAWLTDAAEGRNPGKLPRAQQSRHPRPGSGRRGSAGGNVDIG